LKTRRQHEAAYSWSATTTLAMIHAVMQTNGPAKQHSPVYLSPSLITKHIACCAVATALC